MSSVDDIFKRSGVPSKRKLDPVRDPNEIYKSAKLSSNGHGARRAQVEDGIDDEDMEAGPAPPPDDDDGDYGPAAPPEDDDGDDEEGRFFGGGITRQEADVLDYVEGNEDATGAPVPDDKMDAAWLRRTALAFEKKINRNAELRARHADDPARFIDSEADLDAAVRGLSILGEQPSLYPEFAKLGCASSLVSLLAHENTDVALAAVQIIAELTGDDVAASDAEWASLVDALLEADLLPLLVSNLSRLDEDADDDADREGVYRILEVVENLCSRPSTGDTAAKDDALLRWLLARVQKLEKTVSQNKQYAAEILALLAQASPANRAKLANFEKDDVVDVLLQLVAAYRSRDPGDGGGEEEEYMENLFEALSCIVDSAEGKQKFVDAEGPALCLVLVKTAKKDVRAAALRLLDHAVSQSQQSRLAADGTDSNNAAAQGGGGGVCERIVEYGGLKTLFTLFMKKKDEPRVVEHLVAIFAWMLRLLPPDSAERIRTLAKFVEKDYEKVEKLVRLRREYSARVGVVDAEIEREREILNEEEQAQAADDDWISRRLDAGLFCLQTIDVILAWLIAEDAGARKKIRELLADKDETFALLEASLREQREGVDTSTEEGRDAKEMLTALMECLS